MEDVVAVELVVPSGVSHFIVTFGRVQEAVDPEPLEQIVRAHAAKFGLGGAISVRVCGSLQEARDAPYFFEALIQFGAEVADLRRSEGFDEWRAVTDREMREGRHLYYLGDPNAAWIRER